MATRIATTIGRGLPDLRRSLLTKGISGAELGAAGDRHAQATLEQLATELNQGDVVLSEEGVDDPARLTARRVWIIDPLDGTREFSEPNRHDWAVHVALVVDGAPTAAAVHLPDPDTVLTRARDGFIDGAPRDDLANAIVAIHHGDCARIDFERGLCIRFHGARFESSVIPTKTQHTVRLVPPQVGLNERVGRQPSLLLGQTDTAINGSSQGQDTLRIKRVMRRELFFAKGNVDHFTSAEYTRVL
jgi:hypothetical protein